GHAVEHRGAIAYQRAVTDAAAMQHHAVADGNLVAHDHRHARIHMHDAAILHVAAGADVDPVVVAAQYRTEPDAGLVSQVHRTDHIGAGRDVVAAVGLQG